MPSQDDYLKEVTVFEKLGLDKRGFMSQHLIPLQLTYKHGRDFYLMFPWADGNLKEFWQNVRPDRTKEGWFFNQCLGIAHGLRKIHHLKTISLETIRQMSLDATTAAALVLAPTVGEQEWGRHGDIKPENILWFKKYEGCDENHLVISDFGLTRFNSAHSRSRVLQNQIQGFSGTYRPPDLHLDDEISQRYDVWSLGCVLLEFISWFLLGYDDGIEAFIQSRTRDELETKNQSEDKFFGLVDGNKGAMLKDSVTKVCIPNKTAGAQSFFSMSDLINLLVD